MRLWLQTPSERGCAVSIDAIGFLRRDVSGVRQPWDEEQIRSLAKRLGYNLRKIIVFAHGVDDLGLQLRDIAETHHIDAVVVPSIAHFEGEVVPSKLIRAADVITVQPECTYARRASGLLDSGSAQYPRPDRSRTTRR